MTELVLSHSALVAMLLVAGVLAAGEAAGRHPLIRARSRTTRSKL